MSTQYKASVKYLLILKSVNTLFLQSMMAPASTPCIIVFASYNHLIRFFLYLLSDLSTWNFVLFSETEEFLGINFTRIYTLIISSYYVRFLTYTIQ